jgi:uncharacterized membrane protein YcaP (DUF421 family)
LLGFVLLAGLQYVVAWLSVRFPRFSDLVKSEPTLLLHRGRFLQGAMRAQRVTEAEVLAALRGSGASDPRQIAAVVLETDGTLSVVRDAAQDRATGSLAGVQGAGIGADRETSIRP